MSRPAGAARRRSRRGLALVCAAVAAIGHADAQAPQAYEGYLCCNMLSDGSWISDINYLDDSKRVVPAGTPVKVTGHGRWRLLVEIEGKALAIGNDYSRTMTMDQFAQRYVVADDPTRKLQAYAPRLRDAIKARKVMRGMTREQVVMAVGYPITSYNAEFDVPLWRYWLSRSAEYQVFWGENGRVDRIFGAPEVRAKVAIE